MSASVWKVAAAILCFDVDGEGELLLKHTNGHTGSLSAHDILNGRMRVVDPRAGETIEHASIECLVLDG